MYRGSQPSSGTDPRHSPPPAAMLADMNQLPSIPSRPAPQQPFTSFGPYQRPSVALSRPDVLPSTIATTTTTTTTAHPHHHSRDSDGSQSNAQQLPSLRTLLEPGLLENKRPEPAPRPGGHLPSSTPVRFGSSSPTLKRRHDFDGYSHEHPDSNALSSRAPPVLRHAGPTTAMDAQPQSFSTASSAPASRPPDYPRYGSFPRPAHHDSIAKIYRPPSTVSAVSASSDTAANFHGQMLHDDPMDISQASMRRRAEVTARAPVRASRCVGQREIPGEGLCYVYEDGTYCRAVIDGEPVNPSWGITKAGKPRKRLAQACLTCREKKIKCEPGYPKCHQCAKSQRACRGGLNQPGMSNASEETSPSSSSALFKTQSAELVSSAAGSDNKHRALDEQQRDTAHAIEAWNAGSPQKFRNFRPTSVTASRDMSVHSIDSDWSGSLNNADPDDPRRGSLQDQLALQWEQDPYETDARLTMQLLELYFLHAGRATYGIFPRQPFLAWVETNRDKDQDHLMILYSVLAMGSIFSNEQDKKIIGKRFAAIAAYATEKRFGKFTLQLCQSRLLLALYNFARGKAQEAWDFCGAGLRAISALKLNTEEGVKELPDESADLDYGFDRATLEECCRRTFWSGFLMDRYNGFCGGTLCVINSEDTFLRLPCLEPAYEAATPCDSPFFDFEMLTRATTSTGVPQLSHMAYLTLISTIWGEVLTFTSRAVHRPDAGYERVHEAFYSKTNEQLESWLAMLPSNLQYSSQNLDRSIAEGTAGTFLSLHALYHATVMRLNRHIRVRALSRNNTFRKIDAAFRSASLFLNIMHGLAPVNRQHRLPPSAAADFLFSTPFPGYALMLSIDVLSAAGTVSTLPNLIETINTTSACLEELSIFWASARVQQRAIAGRIRQLTETLAREQQGVRNGSFGDLWRLPDALDRTFGENDGIYKGNNDLIFEALSLLATRS